MNLTDTLIMVQSSIFALTVLFALIYACLILCIRRMHRTHYLFILNICINITTSCIYFALYFQLKFRRMSLAVCVIFDYCFSAASMQIPFAFVAFTVYRYCSIIYHMKGFFKTKQWIISCISIQWMSQLICPLARLTYYTTCTSRYWEAIYIYFVAVVLPLAINIILHVLIFINVRYSSNRIQPQVTTQATGGSHINSLQLQQQQPKINRRDISLLKHMLFIFTMFIFGWTPVFIINIVDYIVRVNFVLVMCCAYLSAVCCLGIIIYLFLCNHELKTYLFTCIRQIF